MTIIKWRLYLVFIDKLLDKGLMSVILYYIWASGDN